MMTLRELGENLEKLNKAYMELKNKQQKAVVGETVEIAGITWRILDKLEKGYLAIAEDFYENDRKFDSESNNWISSELRSELNTTLKKKIEDEIGEGGLIEFERNLLSLDGQVEYGFCMDHVSLINVDEYRKYRKYLPNTKKWWWTLTSYSTQSNDDSTCLAVVSPAGGVYDYSYYYGYGVRPFCIFSSSIFESEEE